MDTYQILVSAAEHVAEGRGSRAKFIKAALERLDDQLGGQLSKFPNAIAAEFAFQNAKRLGCYRADMREEAAKYAAPQVIVGAIQSVMNRVCWNLRKLDKAAQQAQQELDSREALSEAEAIDFATGEIAEIVGGNDTSVLELEAVAREAHTILSKVRMFIYVTLNKNRVGDVFDVDDIQYFLQQEVTVDDYGKERWETAHSADNFDAACTCMAKVIEELQEREETAVHDEAVTTDFAA